jgi:GT2 family glycosyltransferase
MAQGMALEQACDLVVVESDVILKPNTIETLITFKDKKPDTGMVAAITTDANGQINFPYNHISDTDPEVMDTNRSLSFCCTLLSNQLLNAVNFESLRTDKDWYDVHISKKSRALGFKNYLLKTLQVQHLPHSSRPWKNEKYTNPINYYFKKYFLKRDRI